ncbi:MAG: zinc-binding dehydrogenase, partial [Nocardioides sp.]|nr:zinc-binding dehydrogenase [Nocardioides sp.]
TALAALRPLGRIAPGETVLISAAAGATGQVAVRMAKHHGATVIGAASIGKHEVVRALGADHVVDSRSDDLAADVREVTGGAGVDMVLESAGGRTLEAGLVAVIGLNIGILMQSAPQIFGQVMGEMLRLIADGVLVPERPTLHPLADGPKVLADLAARATVGRLALVP